MTCAVLRGQRRKAKKSEVSVLYLEPYAAPPARGGRGGRKHRRKGRFGRRAILLLLVVLMGLAGLSLLCRGLPHAEPAQPDNLPAEPGEEMSGELATETGGANSDTLGRLRELAAGDVRFGEVLEHSGDYPAQLLEMLSRNPDALEFVLGYPDKQGQVFAETIGEVEAGTIPLLLQYDPRWGYADYGGSPLALSGCGPTCLSMVIAGLTGDGTATPYAVARYAEAAGYYVPDTGTSWALMSEGAAHFGVLGEELPLSQPAIEAALTEGRPVICSVRPGDFTTSGHFILLAGVEDGQFVVHDPNSAERSGQLWTYERLEPQIRNLWAFSPLQASG